MGRSLLFVLGTVALAACSSAPSAPVASKPTAFGAWQLTSEEKGSAPCPKAIALSLSPGRDIVELRLPSEAGPLRLPITVVGGEKTDCSLDQDESTGELWRDCHGGVASRWSFKPDERGRQLAYEREEDKTDWHCRYERVGSVPEDAAAVSVGIRPEAPRGRLNPGERVVYQELTHEAFGKDVTGSFQVALKDLARGEERALNLETRKGAVRTTLRRSFQPCYSVTAAGRPDATRCEAIFFDRFEGERHLKRDLKLRWDSGQKRDQQILGEFQGRLLDSGKMEYSFVPAASESGAFFGYREIGNEVILRSEPASLMLSKIGGLVKTVRSSKGVLAIDVGEQDPSLLKFHLTVTRVGATVPLFDAALDEAKVDRLRSKGATSVTYPLRKLTKEFAAGGEYVVVVETRLKKRTESGFDRDYILLAPAQAPDPVETKKIRLQCAD